LIIHLDGTFDYLQELPLGPFITKTNIANGAKGYNKDSIHVCYVGGKDKKTGKPKDTRTPAQIKSLKILVKMLKERYDVSVVVGHNDLNPNKACPCFDAKKEYYDV
jgi:N-acetyl-anhydromuramyl-L-alanine amidase AmpD